MKSTHHEEHEGHEEWNSMSCRIEQFVGSKIGLPINFHVMKLKHEIKRCISGSLRAHRVLRGETLGSVRAWRLNICRV